MKKIVIIGASSGIGAHLSYALSKENALFLGARRLDRVAHVAAHSSQQINWTRYATIDVSKEASVTRFFDTVAAEFKQPDAVVICAANQGPIGPFFDADPSQWWESVTGNLFGTFLCMKAAANILPSGGRIVTFAGGGAFNSRPHFSAYAAAKAAIVRLTETAAEELQPLGIAVNSVAPGFVITEMHKNTPAWHPQGKTVSIEVPVACI